MKLCIPVVDSNGLEAKLSDHFGSAPFFVVVELPERTWEAVENGNQKHEHGHCSPVAALAGTHPDAVVCHGIGGGAIGKLGAMGIDVYRAEVETVREAVDLFAESGCVLLTPADACTLHHGCEH